MVQLAINGITLDVRRYGNPRRRPLLLIRGLGTQLVHWDDAFLGRLGGQGFTVITFDNRDVGRSTMFDGRPADPADPPYTIEDMAADASGILDHHGLERAHVMGISMGGMIAQTLAALHPARVASLASVMSSSGAPGLPDADPRAFALLDATPEEPSDRDSVVAHLLHCHRVWGSPGYPFDEAARRAVIERALDRSDCPAGVARQRAAMRAQGSRAELLGRITAPTLVIHGTADALVPIEHGRDTAARIAGARFEAIEGMGHDLEAGAGEQVADLVAAHALAAGEGA